MTFTEVKKMKDIYEILKAHGVELAESFDKKAFEKELFANYKTVAEFDKKEAKITELTDKLTTATEGLKKFDGVDVDKLNGEIEKLNQSLKDKDTEWANKLAGIEFDNAIDAAITSAKGKNAKAIKALLDIEALKASQNRDVDVKTAIEAVKKDNDYLFEAEKKKGQYAGGTGKQIISGDDVDPAIAAFMKGAGIEADKE